jgi:hypothetical protein
MDKTEFSGCGILCSDCEYHIGDKQTCCPGCKAVAGKPFWGECALYNCIQNHKINQCGKCEEFPCDKFVEAFDPSHGPESALTRAGIAAYRAKHGDRKTTELVWKISRASLQ